MVTYHRSHVMWWFEAFITKSRGISFMELVMRLLLFLLMHLNNSRHLISQSQCHHISQTVQNVDSMVTFSLQLFYWRMRGDWSCCPVSLCGQCPGKARCHAVCHAVCHGDCHKSRSSSSTPWRSESGTRWLWLGLLFITLLHQTQDHLKTHPSFLLTIS